jgi:hypothetical protein
LFLIFWQVHGFLLFWFLYIYLQSTLLSPQHTTWPYGHDWVQMVLIPYTCTLNVACLRLHLSKKVSSPSCGLMNRLLEDESDKSVNITSNVSKIKLIGQVIPKLIVWSLLSLSWKHHDHEAVWNKSKETQKPDEGYSRNVSCTLNLISMFLFLSLGRYHCWWTISFRGYHPPSSQCFYHWVDTTAGELLVSEGITRPAISASITGSIPLLVDY